MYFYKGIQLYNYGIWLSNFCKFVSICNAGTQNSTGVSQKGKIICTPEPWDHSWDPMRSEGWLSHSCCFRPWWQGQAPSWYWPGVKETEELTIQEGRESNWRPSCCFTLTEQVSRSLTTCMCHQMVVACFFPLQLQNLYDFSTPA